MTESTLVGIMKTFCQHWQDHIIEGTLPENTAVQICVTKDYINLFGVMQSPDKAKTKYAFSLTKMDGEDWQDNTFTMNQILEERGDLYEQKKAEQAAG